MAYGFNITDTTYAGTAEANYMILKATFGLDSINKGLLMVKDGIKKYHSIPRLDINNVLMARTVNIDPLTFSGQTTTVDSIRLEPGDFQAFDIFNPRDWETHFYSEQLSNTLLSREIPMTASNFLMQLYLNRAFESIEQMIWLGSTTYNTASGSTNLGDPNKQLRYFDGIVKQMITLGTYISPTGATYTAITALTYTNIEDAFYQAYQNLPKAILSSAAQFAKLKYVVSVQDDLKYEQFLTKVMTFKNNDTTEAGIRRYKSIPVVRVAGLPENTFFLGQFVADPTSVAWFGTNSMDDMQLQIMKLNNYMESWFFKGLWKCDVKIAVPSQLVMHTTLSAAYFNN